MYETKLFWTFMAMLAIVFFCLLYAAYVAFSTWKKIGFSNRTVSTLSAIIVLFLASKFVDNAYMLRVASGHEDVSMCVKSCFFACTHLILVVACYYNTATWIKFALTLECIAKGTEKYFGEMKSFLWMFFAVHCLITTALFCICAIQECHMIAHHVRMPISYQQSLTLFLAYLTTLAGFSFMAYFLTSRLRSHFPSFLESSGTRIRRAMMMTRIALFLRTTKELFVLSFY